MNATAATLHQSGTSLLWERAESITSLSWAGTRETKKGLAATEAVNGAHHSALRSASIRPRRSAIDLEELGLRDTQVLSEPALQDLKHRGDQAFQHLAETHCQRVREEDPAEVFLTTLSAMLTQGKATLVRKDSNDPPEGMIGWQDQAYAYLIPEAVRQAIGHYLRESGGHFPYSPRALYEALEGRGVLVKSTDDKGLRVVKLDGKSRRVLQLRLAALEPAPAPEKEPGGPG